jgi:hypothetical protein
MKSVHSIVLAGVMALFVSPAQAVLVTSLDVNVGGMDYTATFHDFADPLSFNNVWDTGGNDVFGDGEAITPAFDKIPTFWTDPVGAEAARDAIFLALGATDWVDETAQPSDAFWIPTQVAGSPGLYHIFYDSSVDLNVDFQVDGVFSRNLILTEQAAWVTFQPTTVPEPVTPALLLSGLFLGWAVRRRTCRV